ncbi:MAG: adenosylcobinamide-GDP ribazoletransferase [Candidatus Pacebacteria bacterium]|nr:adenosylcobinamide-GDP ribazoletransferase [Candidatus Paceibacterota bacterium]
MKNLLLAIITFTRIPFPQKDLNLDMDELYKSMAFFPFCGFIIGLFCSAILYSLQNILPVNILILTVIFIMTIITGAFHEDGLADVCDSYGGYTKEKKLEIMRDSRIGTFGVLGLIMLIFFKFFLLKEISLEILPIAIITSLTIGRFCVIPIIKLYSCLERDEGEQNYVSHILNFNYRTLFIAFLFTIIITGLVLGFIKALLILFIVQIIILLIGIYFKHSLGGISGDVCGTLEQIGELIVYLLFIFFQNGIIFI